MSAASPEERQRFYDQLRESIYTRDLSNSERFDKAILTYSSSGLALSLGFLKDIRDASDLIYAWMLYGSWAFFVVAIVLTIGSYPLSQKGLRIQLANGYKYYIEADDSAFEKRNPYVRWVEYVAIASGVTFIIAVLLSAIFVFTNVKDMNMTDIKKTSAPRTHAMDGASIPRMEMLNGATIPGLQHRGANIPPLQALPQSPATVAVVPSASHVSEVPVAPPASAVQAPSGGESK